MRGCLASYDQKALKTCTHIRPLCRRVLATTTTTTNDDDEYKDDDEDEYAGENEDAKPMAMTTTTI
jgi:hypothetical protein